MTGNVFFPSAAGASPSTRSAAGAPPAYSIDAFSEFSCFAVSRTPSTSALGGTAACGAAAAMDQVFDVRTTQEQDEELFRDLFAADSDWDAPVAQKLSQKKETVIQQQQKTSKPHTWSTGGGSPFLSAAFGPFSTQPATAALKAEPPTLSAPVPRLNLAELMNARPGDVSVNVWGGALGQLPEAAKEDDDENDDEDDSEDRPESNAKPKAKFSGSALKLKSSSKLKANSIGSSNSSAKLQQETLSFLEKLDLKALLHTPRPDVLDFYPTGAAGNTAPGISAATNQFASRVDDACIENERDPAVLMNNGPVKTKAKPLSKKDPAASSSTTASEIATRLSHMEFTYGTTKSEPRKTRKGTIDRLANPILGYTSTLQALSPDQRRKRELSAMDEEVEQGWSNCVAASPAAGKLKRKGPRAPQTPSGSNLSHLTSSAQIYEAAATASSFFRRSQKPPVREREVSNNQLEDERDNSDYTITLKRQPTEKKNSTSRSLGARKAALKKKMEAKQRDPSNQSSSSFAHPSEPSADANGQTTGAGATFLTQHEDEEEKLQSRVKRASQQQQFHSRPSLPPQICTAEASRQPRRPVSVRATKPESSARAPSSRKADSRRPSEEREPEKKNGGKAASSAVQKPKRPQVNRQQLSAANAQPRKPSNGEAGKPSGRRPFARSNTENAAATGILSQVEPSVPKRKLSVGKPSASAVLLMGATTQPEDVSSSSTANRRGTSSSRPAKKAQAPSISAQTPKKASSNSNQSVSGSATPKKAPTTERLRRPSKESSLTVGAVSTAKNSVVLPSIRPPKGGRQNGEPSARRGNAVYRRAKARAE